MPPVTVASAFLKLPLPLNTNLSVIKLFRFGPFPSKTFSITDLFCYELFTYERYPM